MDWRSVADIATIRECIPVRGRESIENIIEDSYIKSQLRPISIPMPPNVSSTISISMSNDGQYFATTHGDHTVKIFLFHTFKLIREFRGHPRTPWTVKFHPKDSDKVASGCLGCQVMVWSISENICLSKVRLEFSIISISFHPDGDFIAIASGTKLELWDWTKKQSSSRGGYNLAPSTAAPPILHVRNIRAVTFHPGGDYLFAAAPDAPRQSTEAITYCCLYGIKIADWLQLSNSVQSNSMLQEDEHDPLRLANHSVILPHIHLYSDGGLDVSQDGEHLITCSRLFFPPPPPMNMNLTTKGEVSKFGQSPLSTTDRMEDDDENSMLFRELPVTNQEQSLPVNITIPSPFFPTSVESRNGLFDSSSTNLLRQLQFFEGPTGNLAQAAIGSQSSHLFSFLPNSSTPTQAQGDMNMSRDSRQFLAIHGFNLSSNVKLEAAENNEQQVSAWQGLVRASVPSSSAAATFAPPKYFILHPQMNSPLNRLYTMKRMISRMQIRHRQPELRVINASLFVYDKQGSILDQTSAPLPPGWLVSDHLCIFKLQFRQKPRKANIDLQSTDAGGSDVVQVHDTDDVPDILTPCLVNAKPLVGSLMRAITSVKWSPTNRYLLMGFGVRSDGRVQDHSHPLAACEILSTQHPSLPTVKVVEDIEDEVNIAQFNPRPGYGLVYGTKRGKTRAFVLPK